mmetsp:Transcript_20768/g.61411  ORF Transcript_20768/g.61411 Transcript_20768/m.61411 type:complete len:246 (-) Transcript_20768:782-1519(-)
MDPRGGAPRRGPRRVVEPRGAGCAAAVAAQARRAPQPGQPPQRPAPADRARRGLLHRRAAPHLRPGPQPRVQDAHGTCAGGCARPTGCRHVAQRPRRGTPGRATRAPHASLVRRLDSGGHPGPLSTGPQRGPARVPRHRARENVRAPPRGAQRRRLLGERDRAAMPSCGRRNAHAAPRAAILPIRPCPPPRCPPKGSRSSEYRAPAPRARGCWLAPRSSCLLIDDLPRPVGHCRPGMAVRCAGDS